MNLGSLFSRFGRNGSVAPVQDARVMPDLAKFGLGADGPVAGGEPGAAVEVRFSGPEATDETRRDFPGAAAPVTLAEPVPSTGDPVLDLVLARRSAARARLRTLRAELAQERRRLADITTFMRPQTAQRDAAGPRGRDDVEAQ